MAAVKKTKKPINKKRILFLMFGLTIPILNWLIFYVYTNASAIGMAFLDGQGNVSLENFVRFFDEFKSDTTLLPIAFKNTFITFGILFVTFPFKVLVSYFIYKKVPFSGFYRIVFFLPTIIFSVALSMVFTRLVGTEGFIAQSVQEYLQLDYTPELLAESRFANKVVLANMVWLQFPGDLIIWGGTFARIPEEVLESGRVDGTTWWTEFTKIIVPLVWPTVALQMVLMFCGIFSASGNVFLLTGGEYETVTLSAWMYLQIFENTGNQYTSNVFNYMSAVGLVVSAIAITISLVIRRYSDKVFNEVEF